MKHIITFVFAFINILFPANSPVFAVENEAEAAARLLTHTVIRDERPAVLQKFLESNGSPLAPQAEFFVREADEHQLDWKLVAAIAGAESTFGKHIPPGSFNAWGWGIPTGSKSGIGFTGWEQGIATVSEGLEKKYYGRGAKTIYDVGWIYAANGISWGNHVLFFMNQIKRFSPESPDLLDVTI